MPAGKADYVSRGIEAKGLLAATIYYNVVLKLHSLLLESGDLRFDIVHDELKSSPAPGRAFRPPEHADEWGTGAVSHFLAPTAIADVARQFHMCEFQVIEGAARQG